MTMDSAVCSGEVQCIAEVEMSLDTSGPTVIVGLLTIN